MDSMITFLNRVFYKGNHEATKPLIPKQKEAILENFILGMTNQQVGPKNDHL